MVGIDNVQSAISDAQANAHFNGITNAAFICGAAEKVMNTVLKVWNNRGRQGRGCVCLCVHS